MSETGQDVRLGVIGVGWWGGVLADGVAAGQGGEVVACFARTADKRAAFAQQRQIRGAATLEELLADDEIEGVLLATSHASHGDLIVAAAEAGKHVFVEKPFTLTVDDGKRAIAAAEAAGVVLQVGHNKRRLDANRRLRALIESGELGDIVMIETHQNAPFARDFASDYWRADRQESPLGAMTSLGVHMLDTMHYLMGPVRRVFTFSNVLFEQPAIDDVTTLVLEFESGRLGYLGTSFVVPRTASVAVRGTEGTAWSEENGAKFFRQGASELSRQAEPVEMNDTIADQLSEFARAIRGGPPPETGGAEGLAVITVMAAAQASAASGEAQMVADFA